jgi:hypothetical protein
MADHRSLLALAPVIGLAVSCVGHIMAARLLRGRNPYPALAIGAVIGVVVTVAITVVACVRGGDSAGDTFALTAMNAVAALGFAFCYFNFVNLAIASLRIRVLEEIGDSGGWLPRATLLERYSTGSVADIRLERLLGGGHLVERNGRLYSGRLQFLVVARMFDAVRALIFGTRHPRP